MLSRAPHRASDVRRIIASAALVLSVMLLVIGAAAVAVFLGGFRNDARDVLGLSIAAAGRDTGPLLDVFVTNLRIAGAALIGAGVVPLLHSSRARLVPDAFLGLLLSANCCLLGGAFAAYGVELGRLLLPHVAPELAGFALAGGTYVASRDRALPIRVFLAIAVAAVAALLLAAVIETSGRGGREP